MTTASEGLIDFGSREGAAPRIEDSLRGSLRLERRRSGCLQNLNAQLAKGNHLCEQRSDLYALRSARLQVSQEARRGGRALNYEEAGLCFALPNV